MFRMLQSKTYSIIDATFKDMGTSSDYNATGWDNARCTLTRNESTNLIRDGQGSNGAYHRTLDTTKGIAIEFDLNFKKNSSTNSVIDLCINWTKSASITKTNLDLDYDTWHHIKIEMDNGNGLISNTTNTNTIEFDSTSVDRFVFALASLNDVTNYKNFVIYPI